MSKNERDSQDYAKVLIHGISKETHWLHGANGHDYREIESKIWVDANDYRNILYVGANEPTGEVFLKPLFIKEDGVWRNILTGEQVPFRLLDKPDELSRSQGSQNSEEASDERVLAGYDKEKRCLELLSICESFGWSDSPEEAYQQVCDAVSDVLQCDETHLHIMSIDGTRFIKCAYHVNGERTYGWENSHPSTIGRMKWMLQMRKPIVMDYEHPHFVDKIPEHAVKAGVKGGVTIPLQANGEVVGTCSAIYRRKTLWNEEDTEFLLYIGRAIGTFVKSMQDVQKANELSILDERRRLSGEIHDNVSTLIGSLSLHAAAASAALDDGDVTAAKKGLDRLEDIAVTTMRILREELISLRLPLEEDGDFLDGVKDSLARFEQSWGIDVKLDDTCFEHRPIQLLVSMQLMRILNECLSNTLRHANAEHVKVTLKSDDRELMLLFEDDGDGFDIDEVPPERFGLKIMQERALFVGGRLNISSNYEGTCVCVRVPSNDELRRRGGALYGRDTRI